MINRNVDQLFQRVKIFERTVNLDILDENLHDTIAVYGDSFLTDLFPVSNQARYCFYVVTQLQLQFSKLLLNSEVYQDVYPLYFQIQFISANANVDNLVIIQSSQISYFRRMKK